MKYGTVFPRGKKKKELVWENMLLFQNNKNQTLYLNY